MDPLVVKALHIIFIVTWFSGLFYMVRLMIYHSEAMKKEEPARTILIDQFKIMEGRLWYIIAVPSMILTLIFGTWLLILNPFLFFKTGDYFPVFSIAFSRLSSLYWGTFQENEKRRKTLFLYLFANFE